VTDINAHESDDTAEYSLTVSVAS